MPPLRRCLIPAVLGLFIASGVLGQAEPAAGTDAAFKSLQREFAVLYRSLANTGRLLEEDRPAVIALLEKAEAYSEQHPEDPAGLALQFQLARWLEDQERLEAVFPRLIAIKPDDAVLALAWLTYQEETGEVDEAALDSSYREIHARFPDNPTVCLAWAKRLKLSARYDEAIDVLEGGEFEPGAEPEVAYELADCLFSRHRFAEAKAMLASVPPLSVQGKFALQRDMDQLRPVLGEYVVLWEQERETRAAEAEADDLPLVEIITGKGRILAELYENEAPNTVANFVKLAESGFYEGTRFHRYEPNFMIQGGDPNSRPDAEGTPGYGDPGYCIPDEHTQPNRRSHFEDSLAMAKRSEPNSGGCQFYFTHRPTYWLNGDHTVFGRVVEGGDVVRQLRQDDEIVSVVVLRKRDHEYEPQTVPLPSVDIKPLNP